MGNCTVYASKIQNINVRWLKRALKVEVHHDHILFISSILPSLRIKFPSSSSQQGSSISRASTLPFVGMS